MSKGLSTWIWVIGGVLVAFVALSFVLRIISDLTVEKHRQDTLETLNLIILDINSICEVHTLESISKTISFSDFVRSVYASDNGDDSTEDYVSSGDNVCIKFMEDLQCQELSCGVELESHVDEKTLLRLVDKISGKSRYEEYTIKIDKEDIVKIIIS